MEDTEDNKAPPMVMNTQKSLYVAQVCLRISAVATTLAAASVMLTARESVVVFGIPFHPQYTYSSAFKFFAFANATASTFSVLSLLYILIMPSSSHCFFLFLHDLLMMSLVLAGCAAATAVGYIGKFGNSHIGWIAICDHVEKFCNRMTTCVILSYLSVMLFLVLTVCNASRSRQVTHTHPQLIRRRQR